MFCIDCGKEIPDKVKFCPVCGSSQRRQEVRHNVVDEEEVGSAVEHLQDAYKSTSSTVIALFTVGTIFFLVWFYHIMFFEDLCDPSIWLPDDCDDERNLMWGSFLISAILLAIGGYIHEYYD